MEGDMVERREVMGGGLVAGLAALVSPAPAAAQDSSPQVAQAVRELRETVRDQLETSRTGPWRGVEAVREQQRSWIRSTQKYPDFIEVGLDIWDSLHDWHVIFQQPISIARRDDGRYIMVFMFTTIVLRPEQMPNYVGLPYEADRRGA
jgi:hypothetical protein